MADFKNFNEYFQEDENMKKLFGEEKSEPPVKNYEEIPESQNMNIHKGKTKNTAGRKHPLYQKLYRLSAILFAGSLLLFGFVSCVDKDKKISEEENRALAQRPAFSLKALFSGETEVCTDKTIKIGGIKGYCKALSIVADETLDSKLYAQREWFIENSGLSVL